jgi:hypothetical protein
MKKLLVLVAVLALVAAMVVPMAAFASTAQITVQGDVKNPSIVFNAPTGPVNLNQNVADGPMMLYGWNYGSATAGSIYMYQGSSQTAKWTVTAVDGGTALMSDGANTLANYLLIGNGATANSGPWNIANGNPATVQGTPYSGTLTYSGTVADTWETLYFNAAQYIQASDVAGAYSDVITFSASVAP